MLIAGFGWRGAYLAQGGFMAAAFLPLAALFRRSEPPRLTRQPASQATLPAGWTLRRAIRTPHFWLLFQVYVFTGLGSFFRWLCISLHSPSRSVSTSYAAEVLGLGAFLSLPGVIVTGILSDHVGREVSAVVTYGTSIFGVACAMLITSPDQHLLLWLHSCFFGLTWGARGPAITAKTADLFPGPQLGTILGVITIGTLGIGAALGFLDGRLDLRSDRQLPGGVRAFDPVLRLWRRGFLTSCGDRRRCIVEITRFALASRLAAR